MAKTSVNSRILYTEPNFVSYDGADLSINQDNLTIYADLVVETKTRFQTQANTTGSTYVLSWAGSQNGGDGETSFLSGRKLHSTSNSRFLTTYYTDISFDDAKSGVVVEGLGIVGINVEFDSWYLPQVTINFTDVRGSSLFVPNEYGLVDSGTSSMSNGFYKSFFTFPYPKFTLRIKGFYGKPVTYILNCVDFKGEFNSNTGNFESVAKFVGFTYAFLSDIQLQYLVAAPYDSYYGQQYWESHVNSPEWDLEGGGNMITLMELQQKISNGVGVLKQLADNDKNVSKLTTLNDRVTVLTDIGSAIDNLIKVLQYSQNNPVFHQDGNQQYLFMLSPKDGYFYVQPDLNVAFSAVISSISSYNQKDYGNKLPFLNNIDNINKIPSRLSLTKILENGIISDSLNGDVLTILTNKELNDGIKMNKITASLLLNAVKNNANLPQYCYIIDVKNIDRTVIDLINGAKRDIVNLRTLIDDFVRDTTETLLGFKPSVYNLSKILFAHLETFLNSVFNCMDNISGRKCADLNIDLSHSDVITMNNSDMLPPFPAIRQENSDKKVYVDAWIGDFSSNGVMPEESKLIYGYTKASNSVADNIKISKDEINNSRVVRDFIPVTPFDINMNENPFRFAFGSGETLGNFISQLGLRMSKVLSIMFSTNDPNVGFATQAGKADAINYWICRQNYKNKLATIMDTLGMVDGSGSDRASENVIRYLSCNLPDVCNVTRRGTKFYEFEMIEQDGKDNPMYKIDNINVKYSLISVDGMQVLPSHPKPFTTTRPCYSDDYCDSSTAFKLPKNLKENNQYFFSLTDDFVNELGWSRKYLNDSVFEIIDGEEQKNDIINRYNELFNGKVEVENMKKNILLSELINTNIWKVKKEDINKFHETDGFGKQECLFRKKLDYSSNSKLIWPTVFLNDEELKKRKDYQLNIVGNELYNKYDSLGLNVNQLDISNNINGGNGTLNDYDILGLGTNNNLYSAGTLFGTSFYYLQNETSYDDNDKIKIKSLLLLQTLRFKCPSHPIDNGFIMAMPKGLLLLMGGFIWRKRFCLDNGVDDCFIYKTKSSEYGILEYKTPTNKKFTSMSDLMLKSHLAHGIITDRSTSTDKTYDALSINESLGNFNIFELRLSIQNALVKYFEEWALDDVDGFRYIMKQSELKLISLPNNNETMFTSGSFIKSVREFRGVYYKSDDHENMKFLRDNFSSNLPSTYCNITISNKIKGDDLVLYNRNDNNVSELLKELVFKTDLISCSTYNTDIDVKNPGYKKNITINKEMARSYVASFLSTLSEMMTNVGDDVQKNPSTTPPGNIINYRDINIAMYNYFKKIHDSWLIGKTKDEYSVSNFFDEQFIFIDSFYNKVGNDIVVDCEYLLNRFNENVDSTNLYSFLADIYSKCGMLFVAMPNFNNWGDENSVNDIFKPLSYEVVDKTEDKNNFVCMYVHEPSKNLNINGGSTGVYGFGYDGFDIHDPDKDDSETLEPMPTFTQYTLDKSMYVPSFGVAFAKQNQSYFKSIKVGMESPVTTEYAIKAIYQIAKQGGDNAEGKGAFWGQDLYSVWSNYAYTCEIEMLGCAQIQPLMYFQLLNIPLFRGTYIVTKVSHNMKPGYMTTKIIGTKLCKYGKPFLSQAFGLLGTLVKEGYNYADTFVNDNAPTGNGVAYTSNQITNLLKESYVYHDPTGYDIVKMDGENPKCDCNLRGSAAYNNTHVKAKQLFYALRDTIKDDYGDEWGICIYSSYRRGQTNDSKKSDHYDGRAIDIAITDSKGNATSDKTKMAIVFDILLTAYSKHMKQLIWENNSDSSTTLFYPTNCVHFSVHDSGSGNFEVFQAYLENGKYYTCRFINQFSDTFCYCLAKKYNNSAYTNGDIKARVLSFTNLSDKNNKAVSITDVKDAKKFLSKFYGRETTNALGDKTNSNDDLIFSNCVHDCPDYNQFRDDVVAIAKKFGFDPNFLMIGMMAESGINPKAKNPSSGAVGLIQFTNEGANAAQTTQAALLGMNANEQIKYVSNYFSYYKDKLNGKIRRPVDLHLYLLAPGKLVDGKLSSLDSVVYANGTKGWKGNYKNMTGGEIRDILVRDVQNFVIRKASENAKVYGYASEIDRVLSSYNI